MPKTITTAARFIQTESFGAILLLCSAAVAFYYANSSFYSTYENLLHYKIGPLSLSHWINDGLMVLFFFVVGLEIKRELLVGELSSRSKAALPVIAAIGGAITPALIYYFLNPTGEASRGWGIPMATDIAFAVGVLSLFSKKVPPSLKVFLLALAIADDLLAVIVIALFYTAQISGPYLLAALAAILAIWALKYFRAQNYLIYTFCGVILWFFVLRSGVHATIAGVILGLMTPLRVGQREPIKDLIHKIHPWNTYFIMPVFALANAGVHMPNTNFVEVFSHAVTYGVFFGLLLGKPLGVMLFLQLATVLKLATPMPKVSKLKFLGIANLTGIGFTMAIFVCSLSLPINLQNEAKIGILFASLLSAIIGSVLLATSPNHRN